MGKIKDNTHGPHLTNIASRAIKQLIKDIENEPMLIIESNDDGVDLSEETMAEILAWLFRKE